MLVGVVDDGEGRGRQREHARKGVILCARARVSGAESARAVEFGRDASPSDEVAFGLSAEFPPWK